MSKDGIIIINNIFYHSPMRSVGNAHAQFLSMLGLTWTMITLLMTLLTISKALNMIYNVPRDNKKYK